MLTNNKEWRQVRDARNREIVRSYSARMRELFPEDYGPGMKRAVKLYARQADREERIAYYSERASMGMPLFEGSFWQR